LHGLPYEEFSAREARREFPGFRLAPDMVAVYEPRSGFVAPERAIAAQCRLASERGAQLKYGEEVTGWRPDGDGFRVDTAAGTYRAQTLILTTGPWAAELLDDLGLPLTVRRIVNAYFQPAEPDHYLLGNCPIYLFDAPEGTFYGFPHLPGVGLKIGRHDVGEETTARTIRREIDPTEIDELRHALERYLPGAAGPVLQSLTCMYTMTPDEHFIIDRHPEHPGVAIGCGFSGHGFKFASAIGEALGELATGQPASQPIGFLSLGRFDTG
jgi:sarcosine oxidase